MVTIEGRDVLLAAGVAVVLAAVIALSPLTLSSAPSGAVPHLVAYAFAAGFGAVLLLRRRLPRTVLVVSVLGTFAYYILDLPPIGVAVPVVAALFSAAEVGRTRWAVGAGAVVLSVSVYFRLRDEAPPLGHLLGYDAVLNVALIAAGIALGYSLRARRRAEAQQAEIVRLTEEQLAREAESQLQSERAMLSRELHDTLGHTMSIISLHAGVAAEAVGHDDRAASDALARIRSASTRSLHELRAMVRVLRSSSDPDPARALPSLAAVHEVVDAARRAGVEVTTDITVTPADLPAPVDAAAYRVVQESVTNVVRHAGATRAQVSVGLEAGQLRVAVTDDGRGVDAEPSAQGRYGLAGMSERVRLLGGSLTTRSAAGGGFAVEATIPARLP